MVDVYKRICLADGQIVVRFERFVERTMWQMPQAPESEPIESFDLASYEPAAPQGNFGVSYPSRKGVDIAEDGKPRMRTRFRKAEKDRTWKWSRRTSWLQKHEEPSFRLFAPLFAAIESEFFCSRS